MKHQWLRLWHDMPTDPKWRTIARVSGQPVSVVLGVALHLFVSASRDGERCHSDVTRCHDEVMGMSRDVTQCHSNVTRGHVDVTAEDIASALDVTDEAVESILAAMQGRILDGDRLTGWEKRQPKREDLGDENTGAKSAAQRKREQRQRERQARELSQSAHVSRDVTQCHAASRQEEDTEKREINTSPSLRSGDVAETAVSPQPALPPDGGPPLAAAADGCPHQAIIAAYHEALPMCPRIREWTAARSQALRSRWREKPERQSVDWWRRLFAYCAESDFLTGRAKPAHGRKPFEMTLDWLVKAENFAKVLEGRYENAPAGEAMA